MFLYRGRKLWVIERPTLFFMSWPSSPLKTIKAKLKLEKGTLTFSIHSLKTKSKYMASYSKAANKRHAHTVLAPALLECKRYNVQQTEKISIFFNTETLFQNLCLYVVYDLFTSAIYC